MFKSMKRAALALTVATLVGVGSGAAPRSVQAATLLEIPDTIISAGFFSPESFSFDFSVSRAFTDLTLMLTNGGQRITIPFFGSMPLLGGLFTDASLTGATGPGKTLNGPQLLAFGDHVDTFSGVIGPGDYSLQLNFLTIPLPSDFKGSLTATAAVPEPAEWMMMLGGLAIVGFAARRRAKGTAANPAKLASR